MGAKLIDKAFEQCIINKNWRSDKEVKALNASKLAVK